MTPELFERLTRGYDLHLTALPDTPGSGPVKQAIARSAQEVEALRRAWDRPGVGIYYCTGHLHEEATCRNKENVVATSSLKVDIDFRHHSDLSASEIQRRVGLARLPPTRTVHSGGGLHLFYDLHEPLNVCDPTARREVEDIERMLADFFGGDPSVCEVSRLMRLPGSHNSKHGDSREVRMLSERGSGYELSEISDWLCTDAAVMPAPVTVPKSAGNGHDHTDPFRALARNERMDVDADLAAMVYPGNVHTTQVRVALSLVQTGVPVDDVFTRIMEATRRAAGAEGAKWDWVAEERENVRKGAIGSAFKKLNDEYDPTTGEVPTWVPADLQEKFAAVLAEGGRPRVVASRGGTFHVMDAAKVPGRPPREAAPQAARETRAGEAAAQEAPKYKFKLTPFADMRPGDDILYLVDELIPIAGLVVVWGPAKSLKSFWTLDVMYHVARGAEYRDRRVKQGTVIYCAFEGGYGYKKRIEAIRRYHGLADDENVPLYVMSASTNLIKEKDELAKQLKAQLGNTSPAAIVLDTLNRSLVGSENTDKDMGEYVRAAEVLRDTFRCVVIIVHHSGHFEKDRPRGHSSLPGAVDAQLAVKRDESTLVVTTEMMRDGPEGQEIVSRVEAVEVGEDMHGKTLTSLVVVPGAGTVPEATRRGWPKALSLFERVLKDTLLENGETIHELDDPHSPQVRAVDREAVRREYYSRYPADGDTPQKQQESTRKAFNRAVARAQEERLLEVRVVPDKGTMLWLARAATRDCGR
jgi:hypothetical protein